MIRLFGSRVLARRSFSKGGLTHAFLCCLIFYTHNTYADPTDIKWIISDAIAPKKVIIALHGINSNENILNEFSQSLTEYGFATARVTLSGNEPDEAKLHTASKDQWVQNLADGVKAAREKYPNLPLYNLSYSAGAATSIVASHEEFSDAFQGYALFAPAVEIRTFTRLIIPFLDIGVDQMLWPTLAPKEHRAHDWVSMNSYRAVFDMVNGAEEVGFSDHMKSVPGIVFIDPGDEFIPLRPMKKFIEKQGGKNWNVQRIDCEGDYLLPFHLITVKRKLGDELYQSIIKKLVETFSS